MANAELTGTLPDASGSTSERFNAPSQETSERAQPTQDVWSFLAPVEQPGEIGRLGPYRVISVLNPEPRALNSRVKLLDFGLARVQQDDSGISQTNTIAGTPAYMAPEQAQGRVVDRRADPFSLGCVLYRALTGAPPFHGANAFAVLVEVTGRDPKPLRQVNADIPPELESLVMKLLAKDPATRHQSAVEVADAIPPERSPRATSTTETVPTCLRESSQVSFARGERHLHCTWSATWQELTSSPKSRRAPERIASPVRETSTVPKRRSSSPPRDASRDMPTMRPDATSKWPAQRYTTSASNRRGAAHGLVRERSPNPSARDRVDPTSRQEPAAPRRFSTEPPTATTSNRKCGRQDCASGRAIPRGDALA
jgi:serine/threonine protein kinase